MNVAYSRTHAADSLTAQDKPCTPHLPSMVTWILPQSKEARLDTDESSTQGGDQSERRVKSLCRRVRRKLLAILACQGIERRADVGVELTQG